jgi:hypothetical protein
MWKPGAPKPMAKPKHTRQHNQNRHSTTKKRKRTKDTTPDPNALVPLQNTSARDPSQPLLSGTLKTMKFMQRQVEQANAARTKRDLERAERERHWVIDQDARASAASSSASSSSASSTSASASSNAPTTTPTPNSLFNFVVVKDTESTSMGPKCALSRRSFRGFNDNVDRMKLSIRRERQALENMMDTEDDAIGEAEMAKALGKGTRVGRTQIDRMEADVARWRMQEEDEEEEDEGGHRRKRKDRPALSPSRTAKGRRTFG